MKYAIFGAGGAVGQAVGAELAERGIPFRVVGRSAETLSRFARYGALAEICPADLAVAADARRAAAGVEAIVYAVGVPYDRFALHPALMRVTVDAAIAERVARLLVQSNVYSYGLPQTEYVDESHPRNPNTYKGRMRKEQEDIALAAHDRGGLHTTVVRAPDFYGPAAELSIAWQIISAALAGKSATVIGPVDTPHEFIFVPELGRALVALSEVDAAFGQAWNIAGPGPITTREFARHVYAECAVPLRLRSVNKATLRVLGLFNPLMRELVEMYYLQTNPVLLDDRRLRAIIPQIRKTPYDEGIRLTVQALRGAYAPAR
jgi:nucleoside-diphosphate-sugar epimerase